MSEPEKEERKERTLSFSIPQVVGGALAAATAAAIGSTLGVTGTIIGAALVSIVGAIGSTIYSAGITKTSKHVGTALTRGIELIRTNDAGDGDSESQTQLEPALTKSLTATTSSLSDTKVTDSPSHMNVESAGAADTQLPTDPLSVADLSVDVNETDATTISNAAIAEGETTTMVAGTNLTGESALLDSNLPSDIFREPGDETKVLKPAAAELEVRKESFRTKILMRVIVAAIAIFLVTLAVITCWEMLTGRALDGKQGTTVGKIVDPPKPSPSINSDKADQDESESPDPSQSQSKKPSESSSVAPSTPQTPLQSPQLPSTKPTTPETTAPSTEVPVPPTTPTTPPTTPVEPNPSSSPVTESIAQAVVPQTTPTPKKSLA